MGTPTVTLDFLSLFHEHLNDQVENFVEITNVFHKCDKCPFKADNEDLLKTHKENTHKKATFDCENCSYFSETKLGLRLHKKSHLLERYKCGTCNFECKSKNYLTHHIRAKHEGKFYYCDECDFKNQRKQYVAEHKKIKHDGIVFGCDECNHKSSTKQALMFHKEAKHLGKTYSCNSCLHVFKTRRSLAAHRRKKCCKPVQASSDVTTAANENGLTNPDTQMEANNSKKGDNSQIDIKNNLPKVVQSGDNPCKKFTCADCGKKFGSKYNLNRHTLTHSDNSYACDASSSSFKHKEALGLHMNNVHKATLIEDGTPQLPARVTIKEYGCSLCDKTFNSRNHTIRHEASHSGIKFCCKECSSTFSRKDHLKSHMRKKHAKQVMDLFEGKYDVESCLDEQHVQSEEESTESMIFKMENDLLNSWFEKQNEES